MLRPGQQITVRKLPWNSDTPKWECRARVRGVTAAGFTIWIPADTNFRMADGSTWTSQDDSLDHFCMARGTRSWSFRRPGRTGT